METCRLCNKSKSLKDLTKIDTKSHEIKKKLKETFNIELIFSQNIAKSYCCRICIKKLNNSHSFYQQIVENQKKFEAEFNTVVVKVEKFDPVDVNIKEEKEENIEDDFGGFEQFNDDSGDFKEEDGEDSEPVTKTPKKSPKSKPKTTKKSSKKIKPKKPSKRLKKEVKKEPVAPKEDIYDIIYKNEHSGVFTDIFLQLNIHTFEKSPDGRLSLEADQKYSALKWSNNQWKCTEKCNESFTNIVELNEHLKTIHKSKFKSFCSQCGITCPNFSSHVTHIIKYHNTNSRFSCIMCSTIFWNLNDLFKHYKTEHSQRILMCLYCGFLFNTIQILKTHLIQFHKHDDNRDIFICDICNYSTKTKHNLAGHLKTHIITAGEICDQCGDVFKRRGALDMHRSTVHGNQEPIHSCHCGKTFKNLLSLRKHKKIVHQKHMHVQKYECSFCHKKFTTEYKLKCHLYSHDQNSSRYQCPHCDKAFRYTSGFKYHVRSAHTNEKPYGCPCCMDRFFDYANASKHTKGVHGGDCKPIRVE